MKKKLLFSILLNVLLISMLLYVKRDVFLKKTEHLEISNLSENKELVKMNNSPVPDFITIDKKRNENNINVLILGNSLAIHAIAENIGWFSQNGMASSSIENDYIHVLYQKLSAKFPDKNFIFKVSNFSKYERDPSSLKQANTYVGEMVKFNPDVIVYQLGENADEKNMEPYKSMLLDLSSKFPNSKFCLTTPFFPSVTKNKVAMEIADHLHASVADLSNLTLIDKKNLAINDDYKVDKTKWKSTGIGIHPGDYGMRNIAESIYISVVSKM